MTSTTVREDLRHLLAEWESEDAVEELYDDERAKLVDRLVAWWEQQRA